MHRKILVVDDSQINRAILANMMRGDYEVLEAPDGEAALNIMLSEHESLSAILLDLSMPVMDGYAVLERKRMSEALMPIPVIITTSSNDAQAENRALSLGANDFVTKPYNPNTIKHRLWNIINLRETAALANLARKDDLTGLYNRKAFFEKAGELIAEKPAGYYVMACFDVNNFKLINDQYGNRKGDEVLKHIANTFQEGFTPLGGICCRVMADHFAVLYPSAYMDSDALAQIRQKASRLDETIEQVAFSIGRYIVDDKSVPISGMYDRASLAEASVKGRFDANIALYNEAMRTQLLREQEIVGEMKNALVEEQFEVWYQPQYNHTTGALVGSEALVRWRHPKRGLVSPGEFIPVFERNGFIYELDKFVWRGVCKQLRVWIDQGRSPLPVSVNVSRYDVFRDDLITVICGLINEYDLPASMLRLEITESAFAKSSKQIISVVKKLIDYGFTLEIDDFGSGYSSLNTLKDVPAQVLKLDMRFLENNENSDRGGNVLESIVRMARWLGMSVIAEGVETAEQADYLESIGCNYMQGYLYARPLMLADYETLSRSVIKEEKMITLETVETLNNATFWNPRSMDTLIFNSFVGGACIFEYHDHRTRMLRANKKYARVLGGDEMTLDDALRIEWHEHIAPESLETVQSTIARAIATNDEAECEAVFVNVTPTRARAHFRMTLRVIARTGDHYLFYCTNEDITEQREAEDIRREVAEKLQTVMDNVASGITAAVVVGDSVKLLFSNERYYEILGYTRAQYDARFDGRFGPIYPEDLDMVKRRIFEVLGTRNTITLEYRAIHLSGKKIWVRQRITDTEFVGAKTGALLAVTDDITSEKLAEQKLRETGEQLQFLNDIAHDLLTQRDTDAAINGVLTRVLNYFSGNRSYIFEANYETMTLKNTYEVCAEGVSREIDNLQNVPYDATQYWWTAFDREGFISIPDIDLLGSDRAEERELLMAQGIRSLIAVPLIMEGKLIGFLGVDDPRGQLSHVDHLRAIGDYLVTMLTRRALYAQIANDGAPPST